MRPLRAALAAVIPLALAADASAQVVTSAEELFGSPTVLDFSEFTYGGGWLHSAGSGAGTQVGSPLGEDILFLSTVGFSVLGDGGYGLNTNGSWSLKTMAGLNSSAGSMTFWFNSGSVSGVGAFVNYARGVSLAFIEALAADGSVLESLQLDITTSGTNQGAFFGFQRASNDIAAFRLRDGYIVADDVTFTRMPDQVVPEPITMVLLGSGLAGVGAVRRRRSKIETA